MAVENIDLRDGDYAEDHTIEADTYHEHYYYRDDDPHDVALVWTTEEDYHDTFYIYVSATGYLKGKNTTVEETSLEYDLDAGECNEWESDEDALYHWYLPFIDYFDFWREFIGDEEWSYDNRVCDMVKFDFTVSVGNKWPGSATVSIYWEPNIEGDYVLDHAMYRMSGGVRYLRLYYDVPEGWTRPGTSKSTADRLYLSCGTNNSNNNWVKYDDENVLSQSAMGSAIGKFRAYYGGYFDIEAAYLRRHLSGREIEVHAKVLPTYDGVVHGIPDSGAPYLEGTVTVTGDDGSGLEAEVTSATAEGVDIEASADGAESYSAKLVDSKYSFDEVESEDGELTLLYPPLGVDFEVDVLADFGDGDAAMVTVTVPAIECPGIVLDSLTGGTHVELEWMRSGDSIWDLSVEPEQETVKLAGRDRPCSYYGEGGTSDVSFAGAIIDDNAEEVEGLATEGDLMCRFIDGRRYVIVPNISMTRTTPRLIEVSIDGEEVTA